VTNLSDSDKVNLLE